MADTQGTPGGNWKRDSLTAVASGVVSSVVTSASHVIWQTFAAGQDFSWSLVMDTAYWSVLVLPSVSFLVLLLLHARTRHRYETVVADHHAEDAKHRLAASHYAYEDNRQRGLERLYADRDEAREAIAQILSQCKKPSVAMVGVTLSTDLSMRESNLEDTFRDELHDAVLKRRGSLDVYVIDPMSRQAFLRASLEHGLDTAQFRESKLWTEMYLLLAALEDEHPLANAEKVTVNIYQHVPPHCWLVTIEDQTNGWAFFEPYHLGWEGVDPVLGSGLCEKMPVMQFTRSGQHSRYDIVDHHLQRVHDMSVKNVNVTKLKQAMDARGNDLLVPPTPKAPWGEEDDG